MSKFEMNIADEYEPTYIICRWISGDTVHYIPFCLKCNNHVASKEEPFLAGYRSVISCACEKRTGKINIGKIIKPT